MDSTLSMNNHVDKVCRNAYLGIRKISQIRHYLNRETTNTLVHAFVTSRLDTCNSLLHGLTDREIAKVQRVQNTAARLVLRIPRYEHITPALKELHWLPIQQRSAYKIMLITYKALHGMSPDFISDIIHIHNPTRMLRSSTACRLQAFKSSTKFYGDRSFSFASAQLWNNLPGDIRNASSLNIFKTRLKTHLFKQYFILD